MMSSVIDDCSDLVTHQYFGQVYASVIRNHYFWYYFCTVPHNKQNIVGKELDFTSFNEELPKVPRMHAGNYESISLLCNQEKFVSVPRSY